MIALKFSVRVSDKRWSSTWWRGGETAARRCLTRQQWQLKCFDFFFRVYEITRVKCGDTGNRSVSQEKGELHSADVPHSQSSTLWLL